MKNEVKKILLIEDSPEFQLMIQSALSDYEVQIAASGQEALKLVNDVSQGFHLFLIDVMLPDMSGLQICSFIKSQSETKNSPVVMLTSKDSTEDKVQGLDIGADDYITKPFDFKELQARVRSHLRRKCDKEVKDPVVPGFKIDSEKQSVYSQQLNQVIDLTRIEFKLFNCFIQRLEHVLSRERLLDLVWPNNMNVSERTVDSHMSNLRKKLSGSGVEITAVHGSGYRCQLKLKNVA